MDHQQVLRLHHGDDLQFDAAVVDADPRAPFPALPGGWGNYRLTGIHYVQRVRSPDAVLACRLGEPDTLPHLLIVSDTTMRAQPRIDDLRGFGAAG